MQQQFGSIFISVRTNISLIACLGADVTIFRLTGELLGRTFLFVLFLIVGLLFVPRVFAAGYAWRVFGLMIVHDGDKAEATVASFASEEKGSEENRDWVCLRSRN